MENTSILIVEDNLELSQQLCLYLKKLSSRVVVANNGEEALKILKENSFFIILLDLKMPKLNGIELMKKIKHMNLKIIITSGEVLFLNKIPIDCYDKIKSVLVKPFDLSTIYSHVSFLLTQNKIDNDIYRMKIFLNTFDFNKSSSGYIYLMECLTELFRNPSKIQNLEKSLYLDIAKKYNFNNGKKIKWCITKSLNSMQRYTDKKILSKYFIDNNKITPKRFMIEIYDIVKNEDY